MDATPISGAAGAAQVLFTGQLNTNLNAPSGTNIAPLLPTGDLGPLVTIVPRTPDMLAGLNTPAGLLWAANSGSTLYTFKQGLDPAFQISGSIIPGCCGYDPRLGFDTSGNLWLAFYSNSTGAVGEWMGRIDPATGQAVPGTFVKAPQSETPGQQQRPRRRLRVRGGLPHRLRGDRRERPHVRPRRHLGAGRGRADRGRRRGGRLRRLARHRLPPRRPPLGRLARPHARSRRRDARQGRRSGRGQRRHGRQRREAAEGGGGPLPARPRVGGGRQRPAAQRQRGRRRGRDRPVRQPRAGARAPSTRAASRTRR